MLRQATPFAIARALRDVVAMLGASGSGVRQIGRDSEAEPQPAARQIEAELETLQAGCGLLVD